MLFSYGWTGDRQQDFERCFPGCTPARVVEQHRGVYRLIGADGECRGRVSGRFAFEASPGALPAVGDWVALSGGVISAVLARKSAFQRKSNTGAVQTICANLDTALIVAALNGDFNPRRLERYLALAREGGAEPLVLLTKGDLCANVDERCSEIAAIAGGAPVLAICAITGAGLEALSAYLPARKTAALLGSSGVGKSTLVNALAGELRMRTAAISGDDKRGRHTTTHRELILLPSGALLMDSPGLRELSVFDADAGVAATFEDIEMLASACRFSNCRHGGESGCAIEAALRDGGLNASRWANYQKLQRELAFDARKNDALAQSAHRQKWMKIAKGYRAQKKFRARLEED